MVRFVLSQCSLSSNISLLLIFQEEMCQQPVAIFTAVQFIAMLPIHVIGMYALYIKLNKMFNPNWIKTKIRHNKRLERLTRGRQS